MNSVGNISHPNPIIDLKVKHFDDYFKHALSPNRIFIEIPNENHLTILERLEFKLKNPDMLDFSTSKRVVCFYLDNPLFHSKDDMIARKGEVKILIGQLKASLKDSEVSHKQVILNRLVKKLNGDDGLDGSVYFKNNLEQLVVLLEDNETLEKHKYKIEYFVRILVSEFVRVGFNRKDLVNFHGLINRMLSKKLDSTDRVVDNIYSEFPLPKYIEDCRSKEGFDDMVKEFIEKRSFKEQFEALFSSFARKKEGRFLFRVENVADNFHEFNTDMNGVKLLHHRQLKVNKSSWGEHFIERFDEFIQKKQTCLVETTLKYKSEDNGRQLAMIKVREGVDFLNYLGKSAPDAITQNGGILNTEKSFILYENGVRWMYRDGSLKINERNVNNSLNSLYPTGFKSLSQFHRDLFRFSDKSLFRASGTSFWADKILYLWKFIELVFQKNLKVNNHNKLFSKLADVILITEKKRTKVRMECRIINMIGNSNKELIGLNIAESTRLEMFDKYGYGTDENFLELKKLVDYPFINEQFNKYESLDKTIDFNQARKYYITILCETYEQRNLLVHQNKYCPSTINKLNIVLPSIVARLRNTTVEKLIENPLLKINEAVDELRKEIRLGV